MTANADESVIEPQRGRRIRRAMRSIEAAAIAGLLHSVLSLVATGLLLSAPDPGDGDAAIAEWYLDDANQRRMILGVNLLTMSAIMFVWFVAVVRRRVGSRENRFFGTVFFGSGLLVTASWLVVGVLYAAPAVAAWTFDVAPDAGTVAMSQAGGLTMASLVTTRLEAVFIVSTTTVGRLSEAFPRWLVLAGYVVGLTLLLVPVPNVFLTWVFPIWVGITSAMLFIRRDDIKSVVTPPT
ncbi:MAG: hypothetical protein QNM02_14160 [Acidimicrobiia bacterium]|nr:hypothetical protein [Acidimicrobiia bacterium]